MINYSGDELPQGIEIRKDGKVMTADEVVAELKEARAQQAGSGESVAWQFFSDEKWHTGMNTNDHRKHTEAAGIPTRDLYTHPSAELTAARDEAEKLRAQLSDITGCACNAGSLCKYHAMATTSGRSTILRKQAEAVEACGPMMLVEEEPEAYMWDLSDANEWLQEEAQRLSQQADDLDNV